MFRILYLLAFPFLLTACGTRITLLELTPPAFDGGERTKLAVIQNDDTLTQALGNEVYKSLKSQDYFTALTADKVDDPLTDYVLHVHDTSVQNIGGSQILSTKVRISSSKTKTTLLSMSPAVPYPDTLKAPPYKELAEAIARPLVPHKPSYTVTVHGDPKNPFIAQGAEATSAHNPDVAIVLAEQAIAYDPSFPEAHYLLGIIKRELGEYNAAIASFQEAYRLKPDQKYTDEIERSKIIYDNAQLYSRSSKQL